MVRPWSPIWVVAAMATSSTRSGGRLGLRRTSSRMTRTTRSSARVSAYSPFGPDLPKGVRTPSTNTTSREEGTDSLLVLGWGSAPMLLVGNYSTDEGGGQQGVDDGRRGLPEMGAGSEQGRDRHGRARPERRAPSVT